jgi:exopolysaccharide production protein ExoQ
MNSRCPRPNERMVLFCPNVALAFVCMLSLTLAPLLDAVAVLFFLAAGIILLLRRPDEAVREHARFWWVHAIPLWCIATTFWSNHPNLSLRHGVQLWLTFLIAITLASRLSPFNMLRVIFAAFAIACLVSIPVNEVRPDGSWVGLFGSKNAFAGAASIFVLASTALLIDRKAGLVWRVISSVCALLGIFLLWMAQSAGSLVTTAAAVFVGLGFAFLRPLLPHQRAIIVTILMLSGATLAVGIFANLNGLSALVLDLANKDATLTGRTELWEIALSEIRRHPLLGQGYQAFWVHGNPVAEDIWMMFFIESRSGFNFHNTYISNAVEIGIVGVVLQAAIFLAAFGLCLAWALKHPRAESIFFSVLLLRQLILSFGEVVVYFQFDVVTVLSVVALVFSVRAILFEKKVSKPPHATGQMAVL